MALRIAIFLCFFASAAVGQVDSLREEILNYRGSEKELIEKGRLLIIDKFAEGDRDKVASVMKYLNENANRDYMVFYPMELAFLNYWLGDYPGVLSTLDSPPEGGFNYPHAFRHDFEKMPPPRDALLLKLAQDVHENRQFIFLSIDESSIEPVEKGFLKLYLDYLRSTFPQSNVSQDMLNDWSDQFLGDFSASRFESFVRKEIRYKLVPAKWGAGVCFSSGYIWMTKDLGKQYTNAVPIGFTFDIHYKDFTLYLSDNIGFGLTRDTIKYQGATWVKESQVRVFLPEATIGYPIMENEQFRVTPFFGVSSAAILPTEYDLDKYPDLEYAGIGFTTSYTTGINVDFKFSHGDFLQGKSQNYNYIRVRYAYNNPQFASYNSGNIHSLIISVGGFNRRLKRDY